MIVLCKQCKAKMKIADSVFDKGLPTVECPICKYRFKPDPPERPKTDGAQPVVEKETRPLFEDSLEAGWLVVQDKNAKQQSLPLKFGKQTIGRLSSIAERKADVMVETEDDAMSRRHFIIHVEKRKTGGYNYCLSDYSSINKTYLNEKALNKGDEYILKDGDVIRAGLTKLVFKMNDPATGAQEVSGGQPKQKTDVVFGILNNNN